MAQILLGDEILISSGKTLPAFAVRCRSARFAVIQRDVVFRRVWRDEALAWISVIGDTTPADRGSSGAQLPKRDGLPFPFTLRESTALSADSDRAVVGTRPVGARLFGNGKHGRAAEPLSAPSIRTGLVLSH